MTRTLCGALWLAGCAGGVAPAQTPALPGIQAALDDAARRGSQQERAAIERELLPAVQVPMPELPARPPETRFDLNVADVPLQQLLPAIVQGTRYSMVAHPEVKGLVTLRLRDTSVPEVLDVIRDVYGWDWRQEGQRVQVMPPTLQTRLFRINYPTSSRTGRSETRVMSGSITAGNAGGGANSSGNSSSAGGGAATAGSPQESTRVTTQHQNDLWSEIEATLKLLVGDKDGRQVVVSPQSGLVVVRAMPKEMRSIEDYLRQMRLSIERQVMLEAKIVEVRLRDAFQSGVNWAAFRPGGSLSAGVLTPGASLNTSGSLSAGGLTANPPGSALSLGTTAASGLFGLALQTDNFAAMISFLESQGHVQVLSSPRIATLNNQKAVLKVGSDDFFVTSVSTTTVTGAAGSTTSPSITVQPFFSGIALDVTPQIDETGHLILHVRPSVSQVEERQKQLNLGSLGSFTLPLASSSVRETDAIVRVPDGQIVAIGGLMRQETSADRTQVPGAGDVPALGRLLGQRSAVSGKQELIILIKPTVIHSEADWADSREQAQSGVRNLLAPGAR